MVPTLAPRASAAIAAVWPFRIIARTRATCPRVTWSDSCVMLHATYTRKRTRQATRYQTQQKRGTLRTCSRLAHFARASLVGHVRRSSDRFVALATESARQACLHCVSRRGFYAGATCATVDRMRGHVPSVVFPSLPCDAAVFPDGVVLRRGAPRRARRRAFALWRLLYGKRDVVRVKHQFT